MLGISSHAGVGRKWYRDLLNNGYIALKRRNFSGCVYLVCKIRILLVSWVKHWVTTDGLS